MAVNSKKISSLNTLDSLTGEEFLMVAYNNRSYKIKTSLLTSDVIQSITQTMKTGDGAENTITIKTTSGDPKTFTVTNGAKGSDGDKGKTGDKGQIGDTGVALYNEDVSDLILDTVNGKSVDGETIYNEEQLAALILSARQGAFLNAKLEALAEVYCTQDKYDELASENKIDEGTKYFIIDSGE